jgi:hypothetical protein
MTSFSWPLARMAPRCRRRSCPELIGAPAVRRIVWPAYTGVRDPVEAIRREAQMSNGGQGTTSTPGAGRHDDRPIGDLLKDLSEQTSSLVRKEMELARAELTEKGKRAGIGAGMFGGAGLFGFVAFAVLTACFVLALTEAVDPWLAALIVAAVYGAIAGVLALTGRSQVQKATPPVPEQAKDSVREDVEWTKTRAKAARN